MEVPRLRSSAFYHRLTEEQRKHYKAGVPVEYLGYSLESMPFIGYYKGTALNKQLVQAAWQQKQLISFSNGVKQGHVLKGRWAFHSAPTDEAAFRAAASVYASVTAKGFVGRCVSTSTLLHSAEKIEVSDVYIIHGVNDAPNPAAIWALRDFMRDRDGSLHMLVMTSSRELSVDALIHDQLRMRFNYLFCLDGMIEEITPDRRTRVTDA